MAPRPILFSTALGACLLTAALGTAHAQDGMVGLMQSPQQDVPYLSADGGFALKVPKSWAIKEQKGQIDRVTFRNLQAPDAFVELRRLPVSPGARPKQLALIAEESRLKKMPHYQRLILREMPIHGAPGGTVMGSYWYQGNAEFPRIVEEVFVVVDSEAYVFHFECFEPMAPMLAGDVNGMYESFVAHPAAAATPPIKPVEEEGDVWDKIPF